MSYWLTTFEVTDSNFVDYIQNPDKRFQTIWPDAEYWNKYGNAFRKARDSGKLIVRSKVVDGDHFKFTQVWENKSARDEYDSDIPPATYLESFPYEYTMNAREIDSAELDTIWSDIKNAEQKVLQVVRSDFRESGMVIGDPLKNESTYTVP